MARIAESEIERLKREISVQRLAEARGVKLKRHGADLIGLCPFHDDHEPSLVITPVKNLWNCLGACCRGGTVIDWVMLAEGVSFRHAVELLREDHLPLATNLNAKAPRISTVPKLPAPVERTADDRMLLLQVVSYYQETLKQSPDALKYLESRGLKSAEMIDHFRLGFANRTLGYRLPDKNRVAGAELRGRLQKLGIYRESGHEHFNGSVVIPIFDLSGQVVQMYGRKITPNLRTGTPDHLYLPGPHRGVWNEAALAASKDIILCEALIDALTFWCAGYRHVTASYGVNGFTEDHKAAFQKARHEENFYRLRPRRSGRRRGPRARCPTYGNGHRVFPGAVSEEHGRQRIRAQGAARVEESRDHAESRRMAGQRRAAHCGDDRTSQDRAGEDRTATRASAADRNAEPPTTNCRAARRPDHRSKTRRKNRTRS